MLKTYKIRLYPKKEQEVKITKHFGASRYIYNYGLEQKIKTYQLKKQKLSAYDLINQVTKLKKSSGFEWLKEVNSQSLQMAINNLDTAFVAFFRKNNNFPKFKSKKNSKQSFQIPQHLKCEAHKVYLPKIGWVKVKGNNRVMLGEIKTCTVSKTTTNKYFISILVEDNKKQPKLKKVKNVIGIDLGLKHFLITSNGEKIANPKYFRKAQKKLAKVQRKLSRKIKGSNNRNKQKLKVALVHEKINNQRNDFLHKISRQLVNENQVDTFVFEALNVKGMIKNHKLAKSISDVSWSQFLNYMRYKCEWVGKNLVQIGRFEPSSKICNVCGYINNDLKLEDRSWFCSDCNTDHDRDINAAKNIRDFGIQQVKHNIPRGTGEYGLQPAKAEDEPVSSHETGISTLAESSCSKDTRRSKNLSSVKGTPKALA